MSKSEEMKYVTYCGLYCGLCGNRSHIPQQSKVLRDSMIKNGYDKWGEQFLPNFKEFWIFLNEHCKLDKCCPGCRQGGGNPECEIRKCARQRNVDICVNCDDYPCRYISGLEKIYPTLIEDGRRLKKIGLDQWIQEQIKRTQTGFVYQEDKYESAERKRKEYTDAIVDSPSKKKIVVAGPGTGKTYLFKKILKGEQNTLTLTFVNALVEDLSLEFCGLSDVRTLHSFALDIMKEATKNDIDIFPELNEVIQDDAKILLKEEIDFENLFHNKTNEEKYIDFYKRRKKYYEGRYGFSDIIFAAVRFLEKHEDKIPEFKQVLIDEFQDFNKSEVALIDLLAKKSPILIVGDDDQALYQFKSAGPQQIRQRYNNEDSGYDSFSLPYCSRSTRVIVDAANDIIKAAKKNGYLGNRIEKPFKYFDYPDKDKVSDKYPHIIYRQLQARQIPAYINIDIEQIAKEERKNFTVLIICPYNKQCNIVANALKKKGFVNVNFTGKDDKKELTLLDGLKILLKEGNCNLGWRIVSEKLLKDKEEFKALLKKTDEDGAVRIFDLIKKDLKKEVRQILSILRAVRDGKIKKDAPELAELMKKIDIDAYEMARDGLQDEIKPYNPIEHKITPCEPEVKKIPIKITTIQSSKGLDADYVFITHFDDQYFVEDEDKRKLTDQDICKFIVALTRARKKVFLISSDKNKRPIFLNWIGHNHIMEI